MVCHLAPVELCSHLFIHIVPPIRNILPPPLCLTMIRGYLSKERQEDLWTSGEKKRLQILLWCLFKKRNDQRGWQVYFIEAGQLGSVVHLAYTNKSFSFSSTTTWMLFNTKVSLFPHFLPSQLLSLVFFSYPNCVSLFHLPSLNSVK